MERDWRDWACAAVETVETLMVYGMLFYWLTYAFRRPRWAPSTDFEVDATCVSVFATVCVMAINRIVGASYRKKRDLEYCNVNLEDKYSRRDALEKDIKILRAQYVVRPADVDHALRNLWRLQSIVKQEEKLVSLVAEIDELESKIDALTPVDE